MKQTDLKTYNFIDLGLPSGTLWCQRPLDYGLHYCLIDYNDAKIFPHIATVEQAQELIDHTLCKYEYGHVVPYGANGRNIRISLSNCGDENERWYKDITLDEGINMAWLMDESDDAMHGKVLRASHDGFKGNLCIDSYFMAAMLPVFLTVNKKDIDSYSEDQRVIGEVLLSEENDPLRDRTRKVFEQITFEMEKKKQ